MKALPSELVRYRLNICIRWAELRAKLLRRKPFVKIWRIFAELLVHQPLQRRFLFRAPLEKQQHPVHRRGIRHQTLIEFRTREWVYVALETHQLPLVNRLRDAGRYRWSLRGQGLACGLSVRLGGSRRRLDK